MLDVTLFQPLLMELQTPSKSGIISLNTLNSFSPSQVSLSNSHEAMFANTVSTSTAIWKIGSKILRSFVATLRTLPKYCFTVENRLLTLFLKSSLVVYK